MGPLQASSRSPRDDDCVRRGGSAGSSPRGFGGASNGFGGVSSGCVPLDLDNNSSTVGGACGVSERTDRYTKR